MNVQSNDVRNKWVERPLYLGDNTIVELFTQNIQYKEGLKQ